MLKLNQYETDDVDAQLRVDYWLAAVQRDLADANSPGCVDRGRDLSALQRFNAAAIIDKSITKELLIRGLLFIYTKYYSKENEK